MSEQQPLSLTQILVDIEDKTAIRYPVCYDPDIRQQLATAQEALAQAERRYRAAVKRSEDAETTAYLSDNIAEPDETAVTTAHDEVDRIRGESRDKQLIVIFKGWLGREYDDIIRRQAKASKESDDGVIMLDQWTEFCEAAYLRVETHLGDPVEATCEQVMDTLMTPGDRMAAGKQIVTANERPSGIPF